MRVVLGGAIHPLWRLAKEHRERLHVRLRKWNFLDPEAPALVDYWQEDVHLDFDEAKRLQAELCTIFARYKTQRDGQAYTLRLALAPRSPP